MARLLGRKVEFVDRTAVERSRNYIRRRHILATAEPIYLRGESRNKFDCEGWDGGICPQMTQMNADEETGKKKTPCVVIELRT